jgi:hypothetical protein
VERGALSDVPQRAGSGNGPLVMLVPVGPDAPKAGLQDGGLWSGVGVLEAAANRIQA